MLTSVANNCRAYRHLHFGFGKAELVSEQFLTVDVGDFPSVDLVFAWSRRDDIPLIFGQTNFFMPFDVCFFRSLGLFTVSPHPDG